ncbi:unnamed protein product [Soboliphyme baturini]|uniref:Reverse transcriptase domain-containing protein n=1 Tax=Soboliphyme baturini TaxID=241478 RepID=A0A183IX47_9BILA|nr:unnamed protein product [Soboliphyme baturini]
MHQTDARNLALNLKCGFEYLTKLFIGVGYADDTAMFETTGESLGSWAKMACTTEGLRLNELGAVNRFGQTRCLFGLTQKWPHARTSVTLVRSE